MHQVRPVTRQMRVLFWVSSLFVTIAGIQLYVLSAETDQWFAWTIEPPLTAAFLGSFYFAACVMTLPSALEHAWDRVRVIVPGVVVFLWLVLIATVIHLDKFHLDDGDPVAAAAAWIWLAVYVLEPPVLLGLWARQARRPGGDSECGGDIPGWLRWWSLAIGAALAIAGAILFLFPASSDELWPWALTPLTARAVAATLAGVGTVLITVGIERCWARVRWALAASLALAVLVGVAILRYHESFDWGGTAGIAFTVVLGLLFAGSLYGALASRPA